MWDPNSLQLSRCSGKRWDDRVDISIRLGLSLKFVFACCFSYVEETVPERYSNKGLSIICVASKVDNEEILVLCIAIRGRAWRFIE